MFAKSDGEYKNIPVTTDATKYIFILFHGLTNIKKKYEQDNKITKHEIINKLSFIKLIGIINLNMPTTTHKIFEI